MATTGNSNAAGATNSANAMTSPCAPPRNPCILEELLASYRSCRDHHKMWKTWFCVLQWLLFLGLIVLSVLMLFLTTRLNRVSDWVIPAIAAAIAALTAVNFGIKPLQWRLTLCRTLVELDEWKNDLDVEMYRLRDPADMDKCLSLTRRKTIELANIRRSIFMTVLPAKDVPPDPPHNKGNGNRSSTAAADMRPATGTAPPAATGPA